MSGSSTSKEEEEQQQRKCLLIGSMPFGSEELCMETAVKILGPDALIAIPDGEVGEKSKEFPTGLRQSWVHTAILAMVRNTEAFDVISEPKTRTSNGFMANMLDGWCLKAKYPPNELAQHIDFGYAQYFKQSWPIYQKLKQEGLLAANVPFQVGIPTGSGISFVGMSILDGFKYRPTMDERLSHEIIEILNHAGIDKDNVIIQAEIPTESIMACFLPSCLHNWPYRWVMENLNRYPQGTRVGIHVCLGDLNNKTPAKLSLEKVLVHFVNKIVADFPNHLRLEYVHYPFAEACKPPSIDPAFYAPLQQVQLPKGTRFVAGFCHEKISLQEHATILQAIESARGCGDGQTTVVDIACSCGLGRRSPEVAQQLLENMRHTANLPMPRPQPQPQPPKLD